MSVRDRLKLFEEQSIESAPELPKRRGSCEEIPPSLPPRPGTQLGGLTSSTSEQPKKPRPPVPPKSRSISGNLATVRGRTSRNSNQIMLIDLEEEDAEPITLQQLEPLPIIDQEPASNERDGSTLKVHNDEFVSAPRTPSPLRNIQTGLTQFRVNTSDALQKAGGPKLLKTVSENTQTAFRNVQGEAPKVFKTAAERTQAVFKDVQAGLKKTINGIPVPKPFAQTGEDLADLTKLLVGQSGVCSRCASLPLEACFSDQSGTGSAYIPWSTPLSRVALHAKWCRLCQLLLSVLCRREHDPLLLPDVRDHIQPEWLRGVPLHKWVSEGYIHQDEYWPFGRSEYRFEGSTQVVGPVGEALWEIAKRSSSVGIKVLARSAGGRRPPQVTAKDFQRTDRQNYADAYRRGKSEATRYPISCVVMITVSAKQADEPGLLWVDLIGCGNAPGAEQTVLSHFLLHTVKDRLSINVSPNRPLSYGHVLDPHWIDMSIGKLWLTECETRHDTKCSEHGWAVAMRKPRFLRLLDVHDRCITVAKDPGSCRYVALSYVWGGAQMLKLQNWNLEAFSKPRGLDDYLISLPQTIIDAMEVVKEIDERYLWVDALCILQEDTKESHEQIANMDAVYGSAVLTIVAASGDNADVGLHGVRRRHFEQAERPGRPREISQLSASMCGKIEVVAPVLDQQNWMMSEWSARAWTYQEQLLSRRLLAFSDNRVMWHCRCMTCHEDMPAAETGYEQVEVPWLDLKPQYLGVGTESYWRDGSTEVTRHGLTHVVRSGTFSEYARMIEQYSPRKITYESDAINALAGLLRIFSLCFQAECIYGLPTNLLDVAFLWRPKEQPLQRREGSSEFPSWSWAAWKGRVVYDHPVEIKRDESGQMMETEGIRPLLRFFVFDKYAGVVQPLNGTARGLPIADDEIAAEWEAHSPEEGCQSLVHTCRTPDVFDLDPRVIPHLSEKHIVFWTSVASGFTFGDLRPQSVDKFSNVEGSVIRRALLDSGSNRIGNLLLDGSGPAQLILGQHELILTAEAHTSLLDQETAQDDYSYYLVMLTERDAHTGISRRLGTGRLLKMAWIAAQPVLKLICLG